MSIMTLSQLEMQRSAHVRDIDGGQGIRRNLNQLGIHVGDVVTLVGRGAFRGPVLVHVHGMRVALGRGIAAHVHVDPIAGAGRRPGGSHG